MTEKVVDVTIHLDESLGAGDREEIQDKLRGLRGVVAASSQDETPHLVMVGYDPETIDGRAILDTVTESGIQAELVGL